MVPCVNCHGERGNGSREGGVLAPPIHWYSLALQADTRQPYSADAFAHAVSNGIGLNGQPLTASMPRYKLSPAELSALIAYLKEIDRSHPVGVTANQIKLRLILPKNPELANAMQTTVQDYLAWLNRKGGVYARTLVIPDIDSDQQKNGKAIKHQHFVTLDLRTAEIPSQQTGQALSSPFVISVFGHDAALQSAGNGSAAYALYPHPQDYQRLRIQAAQQRGWKYRLIDQANLSELIAEQLALDPVEQRQWALIPSTGQIELSNLLKELNRSDIQTNFLVDMRTISARARQAAKQYRGAVLALLPPGVESVTEHGRGVLARLSGSQQRYRNWLQQRLWALSTVRLLEASLQQSGRDLTLRAFNKAMQTQVDLITDFGPRLSYSANKRIGSFDVTLKRINQAN